MRRAFAVLVSIALLGFAPAAMAQTRAQPAVAQQQREAQARAEAPIQGPNANDARLGGDDTRTRFVMDLDRSVDIATFVLADPYRVVVDLPAVNFRLSPTAGREGRGLVTAFRFGQFAPGKSRIVIDTVQPVTVERAFVLAPADGQPARLVVDMTRATREAHLRAVPQEARPRGEGIVPPQPRPGPRAERPGRDAVPLIVLDPGHGGVDSGATTPEGVHEKTIVLDFARALRAALERTGRVRVAMTREGDQFVSLDDRIRIARERQAALFLSLHADSFARPLLGLSGASVYTLSERASDQEAAAYAERENRADLIAGVVSTPETGEVADILFDLMHRETKNFSVQFARMLVEEVRPHVRLVRNPHRFAAFRVLRAPDVPSALLELGFLTSREDVQRLTDETWRRTTAEAVARAMIAFVAANHGRGGAQRGAQR